MMMGMDGHNMYENALSSYLTPEPNMIRVNYDIGEKEAYESTKPKIMKERKVLFDKGDRVVLTTSCSGLGVGTIGIVCTPRVVNNYDSVAVDILRAHDYYTSELRVNPWTGGHDCYGRVKSRNGKYYGQWVDAIYLRKENSVTDEDILLLM